MFLSLLDLLRQTQGLMVSQAVPAMDPDVAMTDQGDHLLVRVPLAGIDPRSVQVQLTETSLAIAGHRTEEKRTEGPDFFQLQSAVSSFCRQLPLPVPVLPRQAAARWEGDQHLLLLLPKQRG
jgi:HSP20 family molecular chaperone IbpA